MTEVAVVQSVDELTMLFQVTLNDHSYPKPPYFRHFL